jgi:DNA-directed RNA polymerase specialized sigma24 family protein
MLSAFKMNRNRPNAEERDSCATAEDFQQLFASEMGDLFHLALQLTADAEKAESCLIGAMRDCLSGSTVSKKWARIWTRRLVVRNAIRLVLGRENDIPCDAASDVCLQPSQFRIDVLRESPAILGLPDFDRLAFVISVLERYSILDAALLLRRTPRDVNDAIARATHEVVSDEKFHLAGTTGKLGTNPYFNGSYEAC